MLTQPCGVSQILARKVKCYSGALFWLKAISVPWVVFVLAAPSGVFGQTRFVPTEQEVVMSRSPRGAVSTAEQALRGQLSRWLANPRDQDLSIALAREAFLSAMADGDLRWLGTARQAMAPWWAASDLSADGFFLRGLIRQALHDFRGGLADLRLAIAKNPQRNEFWSWQFAVQMVQADYPQASETCNTIKTRFGQAEGDGCKAVLAYRTGDPAVAMRLLDQLLNHPDFQGVHAQNWLAFHRGEVRRIQGDATGAIRTWETHLKREPRNHSIRLALVTLLNTEKRYSESLAVNSDTFKSDSLLVQSIISHESLGNPQASHHRKDLELRLSTQDQRGDELIERPKIEYFLDIAKTPAQALPLAHKSWESQQEPADALLLLRASLETGDKKGVELIRKWQQKSGYEEPRLRNLLKQ